MELQRLKIVTIERDCEMALQRLKTDLCGLADISLRPEIDTLERLW